jgi:uncharacterized membrane protein
MAKMVIAAFDDREMADKAVTELEEAGFDSEDLSVITRENQEQAVENATDDSEHPVAEGAVGGASTGAVIGGLAGLLVGAGALPALGGLLIGGPIAAALGLTGLAATAVSGAVTGAAAGGLIGGLTKLGLSEDRARAYGEAVQEGGILLIVPVEADETIEVTGLMKDCGATSVDEMTTTA